MSQQDYTAPRDQSRNVIWWGISSVDGVTPTPIGIDSFSGELMMEFGSSTMPVMANLTGSLPREGNRIPCLGGVSNDGLHTIIPVSVNPSTNAIQASTT